MTEMGRAVADFSAAAWDQRRESDQLRCQRDTALRLLEDGKNVETKQALDPSAEFGICMCGRWFVREVGCVQCDDPRELSQTHP